MKEGIAMKNNEKGNVSVIIALLLVSLLGFTGLAIDTGLAVVEKVKLSNALDAAILAAAQELPSQPQKAQAVATTYLIENGVDPSKVVITISPDGKSIELIGTTDVDHVFMRLIGINQSAVKATSKAIISPATRVTGGIRPFALENFSYSYGTLLTLKQNAGSSYQGNFGVVALGGSGSSVYENNALYGYAGTVAIGDWIDTEPGNMAGVSNLIKNYINSIPHSFSNYPRDSDRLWTIPIIESLELSGRESVQVTGFAQVFVEDIERKSGKIEIKARFIQYVVLGEGSADASDRGVYTVKLVY